MLADDLLQQAKHLATLDAGRPKQVNLRRAISACYYALFHLLSAECSRRVGFRNPPQLIPRIARALTHTEMKQICRAVSSGNLSETLAELQPGGFSPELRTLCQAFVTLQSARRTADYDSAATFTRVSTLEIVEDAEEAFRMWRTARNRDESTVFLAALLFGGRWSK
jgi:uncharacterized protein (UPF0332 family)